MSQSSDDEDQPKPCAMARDFAAATGVTPACSLPAGHLGDHESDPGDGRIYSWPPDRLVAVVTVEDAASHGRLDQWRQVEGVAVTRELIGERATIAVALIRQ